MSFFKKRLGLFSKHMVQVEEKDLEYATKCILECAKKKAKVIVVGNGGSAAIASHVTVDLTKVAGIQAVNFNEADLITCLANDYGYEHWVAKALEFYAQKDDLVILLSSSGESRNIINGALKAKDKGLTLITFSGFSADNKLKQLGKKNFWVDSKQYNVVEMAHQAWLLAIVDRLVEGK